MIRFAPLLLLLPLSLVAQEENHAYRCDNGSQVGISFSADIDGRPQATLQFADGQLVLPKVPTASGERYRRDPVDLQIQGEEALFVDAQGNRRLCRRAQPAAASSFLDIGGQVVLPARLTLPKKAELLIVVEAHGRSGSKPLILSEQRYVLTGNPGNIPFTATVDRDLLGKTSRLAVQARIEAGGKTRYRSSPVFPAQQDGQFAAVSVEIVLPGAKNQR